jgi:hypothetical protein
MLLTRSVLMQGLSFLTMKIDFLKALSSYRLGLKARFYTNNSGRV